MLNPSVKYILPYATALNELFSMPYFKIWISFGTNMIKKLCSGWKTVVYIEPSWIFVISPFHDQSDRLVITTYQGWGQLRSWSWNWSWNLRSWSWSWYSRDLPELDMELELKLPELELIFKRLAGVGVGTPGVGVGIGVETLGSWSWNWSWNFVKFFYIYIYSSIILNI